MLTLFMWIMKFRNLQQKVFVTDDIETMETASMRCL